MSSEVHSVFVAHIFFYVDSFVIQDTRNNTRSALILTVLIPLMCSKAKFIVVLAISPLRCVAYIMGKEAMSCSLAVVNKPLSNPGLCLQILQWHFC